MLTVSGVLFFVFVSGVHVANGKDHVVKSSTGYFIGHESPMIFPVGGTVVRFLGIPYAEPPVGDRRFSKPVMKAHSDSVFNASKYRPSCIQNATHLKINSGISEDCLYLNVFSPINAISGKKKAVMVWIHGGAFVSGNSDFYDSTNLSGFGDVVVVTINYRLGIFGFIGNKNRGFSGNYGLWDQHLALHWINTNIDNFGGDKHRITIFGQSAGAASVMYQAAYGGNANLFQRVIAESGSMSSVWASDERVPSFTDTVIKTLNCDSPSNQELMKCLRNRTVGELYIASYSIHPTEADLNAPFFVPIWDDDFVKNDPITIFGHPYKNGIKPFKNMDILVGVNSLDALVVLEITRAENIQLAGTDPFKGGISRNWFETMYIPLVTKSLKRPASMGELLNKLIIYRYKNYKHPLNDVLRVKSYIDLYTDKFFIVPTISEVLCHSAINNNKNTFLYQFSHQPFFSNLPFGLHGANHGDEVPYVFGFPASMTGGHNGTVTNLPKFEADLSAEMMRYWTNFAKFGDPNGHDEADKHILSTTWPIFNNETREFLQFGDGSSVNNSSHLRAENVAFWMDLLPSLTIEHSNKTCQHEAYGTGASLRLSLELLVGIAFTVLLQQC